MAFPGNQYKLLALDLDGTLLNEKNQVSPRDAQAVRRAQERGVRIVLCTGRNVREVRAFSDQLLAPPDWLVTSSGAAVQRRIPCASAPSGAGRTDRHERGGRGLFLSGQP